MPLNWINYDEYFNEPRDQKAMDEPARQELERIAAGILQLRDDSLRSLWGRCSPPGVNAQTVVQVESTIPHRFTDLCRNKAIGVKIFKKGKGSKLIHDHTHSRNKLPGLPNSLVQNVYGAGEHEGICYLIQEWIEGDSLETYLKRKTPLASDAAQQLLSDLFEGIIIPIWSAGTIWWDIRAANFCVTERDGKLRLVLIDTDSLLAYADEILETPHVFTKRDKGKTSALKRLKTIVKNVVLSSLPEEVLKVSKNKLERQIKTSLNESLCFFEKSGRLQNGADFYRALKNKIISSQIHS
jgi:serine/threonine protein kinase